MGLFTLFVKFVNILGYFAIIVFLLGGCLHWFWRVFSDLVLLENHTVQIIFHEVFALLLVLRQDIATCICQSAFRLLTGFQLVRRGLLLHNFSRFVHKSVLGLLWNKCENSLLFPFSWLVGQRRFFHNLNIFFGFSRVGLVCLLHFESHLLRFIEGLSRLRHRVVLHSQWLLLNDGLPEFLLL